MTGLPLLALLLSCHGGQEPDCRESADCEAGQSCIDYRCVAVECTSSRDCPFDQRCELATYACVEGCDEDADCLSGERCEDGSCVPRGCEDTQQDCHWGEFCDPATGNCVEDGASRCAPCDEGFTCETGSCRVSTGESCETDADCMEGWSCGEVEGERRCYAAFCLAPCDPADPDPCPRGFECRDFDELGGSYCYADCVEALGDGLL